MSMDFMKGLRRSKSRPITRRVIYYWQGDCRLSVWKITVCMATGCRKRKKRQRQT